MRLAISRKWRAVSVDRAGGEKIVEAMAEAGFRPLLRSFKEKFFAEIGWRGEGEERERLFASMSVAEEGFCGGDLFLGGEGEILFLKLIDDGNLYRERLIGTPLERIGSFPDAFVEIGAIAAAGDGGSEAFERFADAVGRLLPEGSAWETPPAPALDLDTIEAHFPATSTHDLDIVTILDDRESQALLASLAEGEGVIVSRYAAEHGLDKEDFRQMLDRMKAAKLVEQGCLILSRDTGQPLNRLRKREDIALLDQAGVRSPQGRLLSEEDVQDFLSITEHGREILAGAYPMTPGIAATLERLGVAENEYHLNFDLSHDDVSFVAIFDGCRIVIQLSATPVSREFAERFAERLIGCEADRAVLVSKVPVPEEVKSYLEHVALRAPVRYIESSEEIDDGLEALFEGIRQETAEALLEEFTPLTTMNIAPLLLATLPEASPAQ